MNPIQERRDMLAREAGSLREAVDAEGQPVGERRDKTCVVCRGADHHGCIRAPSEDLAHPH